MTRSSSLVVLGPQAATHLAQSGTRSQLPGDASLSFHPHLPSRLLFSLISQLKLDHAPTPVASLNQTPPICISSLFCLRDQTPSSLSPFSSTITSLTPIPLSLRYNATPLISAILRAACSNRAYASTSSYCGLLTRISVSVQLRFPSTLLICFCRASTV